MVSHSIEGLMALRLMIHIWYMPSVPQRVYRQSIDTKLRNSSLDYEASCVTTKQVTATY